MLQAIAANEMNHQEHQQAAAHHHRDCDLQGELHVVKVGNSAHQLRAESANQLRDKHVDADGSGMRPPRHHVVNDRSHWAVIPGHEEGRQRERGEYEHLLVGLYSQKKEGSGEKKGDSDGDNAPEGETPLQAIRDKAAEKHAAKTTHQADHRQRDGGLAQTEIFVGDGEIHAPGEQGHAGKGYAGAARNHGEKRRYGEYLSNGADFGARSARRLLQGHDCDDRNKARGADHEKSGLPAETGTDDTAESLAGGAAQKHAAGANGLRGCALLEGKRPGNHGLRCWGVSGFTDTDERARDQQEKKTAGESAGEGGEAPTNNSEGDDGFAAETIREKTERDAADSENKQEPGLQGAELRIGDAEMRAQHGDQRNENPARGKVDKVDQNKYSKETDLIGAERNGFG